MDAKLKEALNTQVTAEYEAAMLYQQLAYEMDLLSLPGMSAWLTNQAAEERVHAEKFATHLLDRGEHVALGTIPAPEVAAKTPLEAFQAALAHEEKVSEMIRDIARIADDVKDFDSRSLITWFLDEQVEEESSVGEIVDKLTMVGDDGSGILRIDSELGAARPTE